MKQPVSQGCALSQVGQDVPSELARACFSNNRGTVQAQQAEQQEHLWETTSKLRRDAHGKTKLLH